MSELIHMNPELLSRLADRVTVCASGVRREKRRRPGTQGGEPLYYHSIEPWPVSLKPGSGYPCKPSVNQQRGSCTCSRRWAMSRCSWCTEALVLWSCWTILSRDSLSSFSSSPTRSSSCGTREPSTVDTVTVDTVTVDTVTVGTDVEQSGLMF